VLINSKRLYVLVPAVTMLIHSVYFIFFRKPAPKSGVRLKSVAFLFWRNTVLWFTVTSGCYTCIYFVKMIQMSRPRSTANEFLWYLLLLRNHFISIVGKSLFVCWDTFLSVCFRFHSDISDFLFRIT
jgi:hypothetical protein